MSRLLLLFALMGCPEPPPAPEEMGFDLVIGGDQQVEVDQPLTLSVPETHDFEVRWQLGDGRTVTGNEVEVSWPEAGRYAVTATSTAEDGRDRTVGLNLTVVYPKVMTPRQSTTLTQVGDDLWVVVSEDSGELVWLQTNWPEAPTVIQRSTVCERPRYLSAAEEHLAVSCPDSDEIWLGPSTPWTEDAAMIISVDWGSRPAGLLTTKQEVWVVLQGQGALLQLDASTGEPLKHVEIGEDPRGISLWPDGRLAITRWRSGGFEGAVYLVDPDAERVESLSLAFDGTLGSDTESGGIPSWLDSIAVSPDGLKAAVPSTQLAVHEGVIGTGVPLSPETTVRAVVSWIDPVDGRERFDDRKRFDNRGSASAATFSPSGDALFVAMRGSHSVERLDRFTGAQTGTLLNTGISPRALTLSADGRYLWVDSWLSREVRIYDLETYPSQDPVAVVSTVDAEPLSAELLRGKQLFNTSGDPRLAKDSYIACSHCHLEGSSDRQVWDFTARGEGLRNTIDLLGRAGVEHGLLHWSGNFDEVHDFEHDIRGPFGGEGLSPSLTLPDTLGDALEGASDDLDALAAYVSSLDTFPRSPFRDVDGQLTEAALRGKALFEDTSRGCVSCHTGPDFTDSGFNEDGSPRLHDVGTLTDLSGGRLGGPLLGLDTPTLHGLFDSAPYLHDGRADTLTEVLSRYNPDDAHGITSDLTETQLEDLVSYLLSLDGP